MLKHPGQFFPAIQATKSKAHAVFCHAMPGKEMLALGNQDTAAILANDEFLALTYIHQSMGVLVSSLQGSNPSGTLCALPSGKIKDR